MRRLLAFAFCWIALAAPTTVDRFHAVGQICQNLATMQNNMRANSKSLKASHDAPLGSPITTVGVAGYTAGSGILVVANGAVVTVGGLIAINNAQHSVLRVVSKASDTLTVTAKQNDANGAAGIQVSNVSNLFEDFPATQQAFRDLGVAFNQRLDKNANIFNAFPSEVSAGATAIGVDPADLQSLQTLLRAYANLMATATITNQTQLDNGVNTILTNVPAAMLPF